MPARILAVDDDAVITYRYCMAIVPDRNVLQSTSGRRGQTLYAAIRGKGQHLTVGSTGQNLAIGRLGQTIEMIPTLQQRRHYRVSDRLRFDEQSSP
ncbi:hypothetical protein D3C76_1520690 [compost metagenome]